MVVATAFIACVCSPLTAFSTLFCPSSSAFKPSRPSQTKVLCLSTLKNLEDKNETERHVWLFEGTNDFVFEEGYTMRHVCDRLIDVLLTEKTKITDWKKLLSPASEEWSRIRPYFFKRCRYRAAQEKERDAKKASALLSLAKKLRKIDADIEKNNNLLAYVQEHWPELDVVVAGRRKDFTDDFFQHVELLSANCDRLENRDSLARVAAKCLAAVEAHDRALDDKVALTIAQRKFDSILDSSSLDEACEKIDALAKAKKLDSALMLLITKTWATAKDSDTMNHEMKELVHYIYIVARGSLQKMIPKEIRILQRILSFEDASQRFGALTNAFSPGSADADNTSSHSDSQHLYTKPERLLKWINLVLDAYHLNRESTVIESARKLMTPVIIGRLEILRDIVEEEFLHSSTSS